MVSSLLHIGDMLRKFVFMTGFAQYRIQASDRDEAIRLAIDALKPNADTMNVNLNTMRDEDESQRYFVQGTPEPEHDSEHAHADSEADERDEAEVYCFATAQANLR
jgi:hypothetical protein